MRNNYELFYFRRWTVVELPVFVQLPTETLTLWSAQSLEFKGPVPKKKYLQSAQVDKGQAICCNLTAITIKASNGRPSFYRTPVFASSAAAIDGCHIMTKAPVDGKP